MLEYLGYDRTVTYIASWSIAAYIAAKSVILPNYSVSICIENYHILVTFAAKYHDLRVIDFAQDRLNASIELRYAYQIPILFRLEIHRFNRWCTFIAID